MLAVNTNALTPTAINYDVFVKYPSEGITSKVFDLFLNDIKTNVSDKTLQTYIRNLRQFNKYLEELGENHPTKQTIQSFKQSLIDSGKKPTTINAYITVTRMFFEWTEQVGLYPNISKGIKGSKLNKAHKKDYLTSSQVKQVLAKALEDTSPQGIRNYAILVLMFTTGLRTIEVARAQVEDMQALGNNTVLYIQGKGKEDKADYVKIAPEVEQIIRSYLKLRCAKPGEPLFTSTSNNSKGKELTTRSISKIVKQAFLNTGFNSDRLTAHSTRHTAVTLALISGEDLEAVKQFARHSNINTTLIYSHALELEANNCSKAISNLIF